MKTTWILDVGNTRTKLAVFNEGELTSLASDHEAWEQAQSVSLDHLPPSVLVAATGNIRTVVELDSALVGLEVCGAIDSPQVSRGCSHDHGL